MGIKENVEKYLKDIDTKNLFRKIYEGFENEGKDGVKKALEKEAEKIKKEFKEIKEYIEKQIRGGK